MITLISSASGQQPRLSRTKIDNDREYDYHLKLVSSPCDLEYQSDLEYQISNQVLGESHRWTVFSCGGRTDQEQRRNDSEYPWN